MRQFSDIEPRWAPLRGSNLIEASAGTGKTHTITTLFLRLIVEKGMEVDEILVVTYTRAATEELRDRIRRRLRLALVAFESGTGENDEVLNRLLAEQASPAEVATRLRLALSQFDEAPIYTIHSFCQRVLRDNAFESRALFDTELVTDQASLLSDLEDDFWRTRVYPRSEVLVQYLRREKLTPGVIHDIGAAQGALTNTPFVPEPVDLDVPGLEGAYQRVVSALRALWETDASVIEGMLGDKTVLKNPYKPEEAHACCEVMDGWLASPSIPDIPPRWPKEFRLFTTASLAKAVKKGAQPPVHPFFEHCDRLEELFRRFKEWPVQFKVDFVSYARGEQKVRKQQENVMFFDDLLQRVAAALAGPTGKALAAAVRAKYRAALIDEFQDTDPVQYEIFRSIYGEQGILFLIGDPKQAIYGFRGADIHAYLKAASDNRTDAYTLDTNWRSEERLINAINAVFAGDTPPFAFRKIGYRNVKAPPQDLKEPVVLCENGVQAPPLRFWLLERPPKRSSDRETLLKPEVWDAVFEATASEIARLIEGGGRGEIRIGERGLRPADIAVIVKTHRQSRMLKAVLDRLKIPSVLYAQDSVFDSQEAGELLYVLGAVADPGNGDRVKAALLTRMMGETLASVLSILEDPRRWEERVERFRDYHEAWRSRGFIEMFRRFLAGEGVGVRLLGTADGERCFTNVIHAGELLQRAVAEHKLDLEGLITWLQDQRTNRVRDDERQLRLESDEERLKIVTMHHSKGLEYPVVFCPTLWDGYAFPSGKLVQWHDPDAEDRLFLDIGSPAFEKHKNEEKSEAWKESLRLLYVSLTRAKHRCYVVWGAVNQCGKSALAYTLHRHRFPDAAREGDYGAIARCVEKLTDEEIRADLDILVERSGGNIQVDPLPGVASAILQAGLGRGHVLVPRPVPFTVRRDWRVASYTALASHASPGTGWPDDERRDRDQHEGADGADGEVLPNDPMFLLPRGASVGVALHKVFENLDFTRTDTAHLTAAVDNALRGGGLDEQWKPAVSDMVGNVLRTGLLETEPDFTLAGIVQDRRLNELEFYFPLDHISPAGLRSVFETHSGSEGDRALFQGLDQLDFRPLRGFMKGYVDLVFRWNEKFYLADYKSNHLGDSLEDYRWDRLPDVMAREQYVLQYHVYVVALHRYLSTRLDDYEYGKHFGGVFYFFLRGMRPEKGPSYGIFHDRPSGNLINALSGYFSGGKELP